MLRHASCSDMYLHSNPENSSTEGLWKRPAEHGRLHAMFPTIEAEVDEKGHIRPKEPFALPPGSRVLITVLESDGSEPALLSEADWERPEEEAAWSHLPRG